MGAWGVGVECVEGEGLGAGAGWAGSRHQLAAWNFHVDAFEVVHSCSFYDYIARIHYRKKNLMSLSLRFIPAKLHKFVQMECGDAIYICPLR